MPFLALICSRVSRGEGLEFSRGTSDSNRKSTSSRKSPPLSGIQSLFPIGEFQVSIESDKNRCGAFRIGGAPVIPGLIGQAALPIAEVLRSIKRTIFATAIAANLQAKAAPVENHNVARAHLRTEFLVSARQNHAVFSLIIIPHSNACWLICL